MHSRSVAARRVIVASASSLPCCYCLFFCFFFFQAEDGIRDHCVTGVQTCALPIYGEMTGTTWVEESGFLAGPVMITNTHSVGVVRDAAIQWRVTHGQGGPDDDWWSLPVVAETWDGWLNDINGFHVKPEDALHAIDSAHTGPVEEGNVGGGTGMICNEFKGGIGTASRKLSAKEGGYTVGVLAQCNYGRRQNLRIA